MNVDDNDYIVTKFTTLILLLFYLTLATVVQRLSFGLVHHRLWVQIPVSSQKFQCYFSKPYDVQEASIEIINLMILQDSKHEQFKMSSQMSPPDILTRG